MRLKPEEVVAIKDAAETFGESVVVRLFGSRADDAERGGDIGLHVGVEPLTDERTPVPRSRSGCLRASIVRKWI